MTKLEALELLKDIFDGNFITTRDKYDPDDTVKVIDYEGVMQEIENKIMKEKTKPVYYDVTHEEHEKALWG